MIFRFFLTFILGSFFVPQFLKAGEIFDSIRDHVNQSWYSLAVGDCKNTDKNASRFQKSQFKCYLQSNGYSKLAGFEKAEQLKDLNQDLQEKLFFDAVVTEQAQRNSCQYDVWSSLSLTIPDSKGIQASNKALSEQHSALTGHLKLGAPQDSAKAKEAQTLVIKKMIEVAKDIIENEKKIKVLNRSTRNYEEIQKIRLADQLEEESIPFAQDQDARKFFKDEIFMPMKIDSFKNQTTDFDGMVQKLTGAGPHSFQSQVVEEKLKKIKKEQSDIASMNGSYSDQHSYKVAAFENGDAERMLYLSGADKPDFSRLSCQMQAKYGIGSEIASLATNSAVTVGSTLMGPAGAIALKLAQSGVLVARSEMLLTTAVKGLQYATAGVDLGQAVLHDCVASASRASFSACSAADDIKKNSVTEYVNKDISNASCVMNSVLGVMNLRGAQQASKSLSQTVRQAASDEGAVRSEIKAKAEEETSTVSEKLHADKSFRPKIKTILEKDIRLRNPNASAEDIELPMSNPGDRWGIDPNTDYASLNEKDKVYFPQDGKWGMVLRRDGRKLKIINPQGKLIQLDLDEVVKQKGYVWHLDLDLPSGNSHTIKIIDGINNEAGPVDPTELKSVRSFLAQLPANDLNAIDTIRLQPYTFGGDANVRSSVFEAVTGSNAKTMDFYSWAGKNYVNVLSDFMHEFSHQVAKKTFDSVNPPSEWIKAMDVDSHVVSKYAKTDPSEDFAESCVMYFLAGDRPDLRQKFGTRFKILDDLFLKQPSLKEQMLSQLKQNKIKAISLTSGGIAVTGLGKVFLFPDLEKK